jgi:hypothetical protein
MFFVERRYTTNTCVMAITFRFTLYSKPSSEKTMNQVVKLFEGFFFSLLGFCILKDVYMCMAFEQMEK